MRWMTLFVGATLVAACGTEQPVDSTFEPPERFSNAGDDGSSGLVSGRIDGRLGRFDVQSDEVYGYVGRSGRSVYADLRGREDGVLMAFLELQNVNPREMEVGDRLTGGMDMMEGPRPNRTDGSVFMFACAGETDDEWDLDVPADDVEVEVEDKNAEEGTITMGYTASLVNGQSVSGQFTVRFEQTEVE